MFLIKKHENPQFFAIRAIVSVSNGIWENINPRQIYLLLGVFNYITQKTYKIVFFLKLPNCDYYPQKQKLCISNEFIISLVKSTESDMISTKTNILQSRFYE